MIKSSRVRALFSVLATLTVTLSRLVYAPSLARADSDLSSKIDAYFKDFASAEAPGAVVIVMREGKVLFKRAYGMANIRDKIPVDTDTAFHLASVGKQITAIAILLLAERDSLNLDDLVSTHLPQFEGWGAKITIRHLLNHISGLPDYYDVIEESYGKPSNLDALEFLEQQETLAFLPSTRFEYSNTGYDTLAAIVEKVSKQSFSQFLEANIFKPHGMHSTFAFDEARRSNSKRAIGYSLESDSWSEDDTSALNLIHGSGSIYSTIEDMAKYDAALFSYKIINKKSLEEMCSSGRLENGDAINYGFGWGLFNDDALGLAYIGHSGSWMGFTSYYMHYLSSKVSVIVLTNSSEAEPEVLASSVVKLFLSKS